MIVFEEKKEKQIEIKRSRQFNCRKTKYESKTNQTSANLSTHSDCELKTAQNCNGRQ